MLLEVTHDTQYKYNPIVEIAQHFAYLKPTNLPTQQILNSDIQVKPESTWKDETIDSYGNICTFFSLQNRHEELLISAKSLVKTIPNDYSIGASPTQTVPWELVRQYFQFHSNYRWDSASEFLFTSPFIALRTEFLEFAKPSFTNGRPILEAAIDLMSRIYKEFLYASKSTDISTPAIEALKKRKGVCQDFAHILIASLRSMGLPAKYISGYILTTPPPGKTKLIGGDASHAWVSIYIPTINSRREISSGFWCDLDPTNNRWGYNSAGEDYIHLAQGRDYSDVSPVRGVIHGGVDHLMNVSVTVKPVLHLIS